MPGPGPIRRKGLWEGGPVADGQAVSQSWLNQVLSGFIRRVKAGPGISVYQNQQEVMICATGQAPRLGGGGGNFAWITGTKAEIDGYITLRSLTPPEIAYATDLQRYYHLIPSGNDYVWRAWSFLE